MSSVKWCWSPDYIWGVKACLDIHVTASGHRRDHVTDAIRSYLRESAIYWVFSVVIFVGTEKQFKTMLFTTWLGQKVEGDSLYI